jgi:quercetin dioxygenase-like cupin family protein
MSDTIRSESGIPVSKAVRLEAIIAYSAGAIVSKTLVQRGKGTITLFSFDKGQGLSEHTAPFDAFVQILEGKTEIMIGGESVPAKAGETVLMPANVPHALTARTRFKMLLTMIRE